MKQIRNLRFLCKSITIFTLIPLLYMPQNLNAETKLEKATFAGGCFWCMEPVFQFQPGVIDVQAGYMGGTKANPTYEEVSTGKTGYREVAQITYDPAQISYSELLEIFWYQIDPTDPKGQFADKGTQYKTAIFYHDEEQRKLAEKSKQELGESGIYKKPIVTEIIPASAFYKAEEYHQDYYKKNPEKYKLYKKASGRESFLEQIQSLIKERKEIQQDKKYQKPSEEELKSKLTPLQYNITQQCGTEKPFDNEYWNNKKEGIYVDIVTGEPLFSSKDKFNSGTGWPSFTKPLEEENIVEKEDRSLFMRRTEVKSKQGDSHLGHVFSDGPQPTGLRYCINSASLRFIPKEDLEKEGYGEYLSIFSTTKGGENMKITSPDFQNNQLMPSRFTCDGGNINPALVIEGIPEGTKSLALIMDDPDAPMGTWVHWVVFDMPVTSKIEEDSIPGKQGNNTAGGRKYHGPCPPSGTHRYFFKIYALDTVLNLNEGITKAQLEKAMENHILGKAELIGLYKKEINSI